MPFFNPYTTLKEKPNYLPQLNAKFKGTNFDYLNPQAPESGASGFDASGVASAATTGLSLIGDAYGMANQSLGLGDAPTQQYSATGQPVYSGSYYNDVQAAKPQGATFGEAAGGAIKGASAGAAVGGPVGAAIGGVVGLGAALIGGRSRKKKQEREKRRANTQARAAQNNFNTADKQFDDQQIAQSDYFSRLNNTNRLRNLYSYND